ncbi:MAG: Protein of unknown function (DUF1587)/Protein of unknown function (DUF1592)/Protein of unknown [Chthoniobacteraceae bacterium]|nr:Protein of unknown function (DUF1587)/Protein of unknown function (DUF1592)/Protein of unknown [Chthoniobacteraceae bacterium]
MGAGPVTLQEHIKPVLKEFCYDCHNAKKQKGDLNLEPVGDNPNLAENRVVWEKIAELIESGEMPPEKKPQPADEQRDLLLNYIGGQLSQFDCKLNPNPGRVTLRRLNREEYRNTIRDLLNVDFLPEDFPNDEVGYGFDNIGDVLSLSPMLMEKFVAAADEIVKKAIRLDAVPVPVLHLVRGEKFVSPSESNRPLENRGFGLYVDGEATTDFEFPKKAEYLFRVRAYGEQAGPEAPKLALRVNDRDLAVFEVPNEKGKIYEVRAAIDAGTQKVAIGFLNNYNNANSPDDKLRGDRNLFVDYVEIEAPPLEPTNVPESHRRLVPRMPQAGQEHQVATEILSGFLRRAYRRPVSDAEVERVTRFVDMALAEKGTFLEGLQVAIQATLCSPNFLYRWELDPQEIKPGDTRDLNDFEVASRLSYFLWSSMPDAELSALAQKGELRKEGNLEKQAARMLKDGKARAFVNSFAGQWLQIRNIWEVSIDPNTFPKWDDSLKGAMKEETELFFQAIVQEDRDVRDLVGADFSFLNEKLARFYGIDGVKGDHFQRVTLPKGSPRGGVITQASVLLSTSTPTRTAPVIRGKWILEQILGTPPPAPPADVPPLTEQKAVNQTATLRQRMEEHVARDECASCHKRMDPLGFALENFDATGAWRDTDGKFSIDASAKLPGGKAFNGAGELKAVLKDGKQFVNNLTEKMLTYALGRGLDYYDRCAVQAVVKSMEPKGNKFSALVAGIVTSEPFLKRKSDTAATPGEQPKSVAGVQ